MTRLSLGLFLSLAIAVVGAQQKYGAKVVLEKKVDFAKITTYSWSNVQPAALKSVDDQIVVAIDRELKALGFTKVDPGPGQVQVIYTAIRRTDVKPNPKADPAARLEQFAVGTLSVILIDPAKKERILELRLDKPIDTNLAQAETTINGAVAELFTQYPTRRKK